MSGGHLLGAHALVTGGGTGIGLACAGALAAAGAAVTVLGRRAAPLEAAVASGRAHGFEAADATDGAALASAVARAEAARGRPVSLLVCAAGAAESAPFHRADDAMWERMWRANVMGAVSCARAVLPGMLAAGSGRVVNVASTAALRGYAYITAYAAAKHALLGYTRSLAQEVAGRGVTANAVCPGFTDTAIVEESVARIVARTGRGADEARTELARHNPMGRLVSPEEVAAAVLFLCGPGASAVNGRALAVDGGEVP